MSPSSSPRRPRRGRLRRSTSDRKSTRLNSSHDQISYAVFCLKKKKEAAHRVIRQVLDQLAIAELRVAPLGGAGRAGLRGWVAWGSDVRDENAVWHGLRRLPQ